MNIKKMMKQAQEMQRQLQEEMAAMTREGSAGGGMVTVVLTGAKEVTEVRISPEVVTADDVEMLQDLVVAAFRDAAQKVDDALKEKMGGLGGALGL